MKYHCSSSDIYARRCIYEHTSARARVHTLYFQPQSWFTSRPESRNSRSL